MLPGPLLYLLQRSSCYYTYTQEDRDYGMFQLNRCVFYCFGALCQQERSITSSNVGYSIYCSSQGGDTLPSAHSGRVLVTTWWLFVTVLVVGVL